MGADTEVTNVEVQPSGQNNEESSILVSSEKSNE